MIGLVLVTHGNLALEFVSAMQHVVGKQEQIGTVCIGPEDDMESRRNEIMQKVKQADRFKGTGRQCLLLTETKLCYDSTVTLDVLHLKVSEKITSVTDHLKQATTRMMVIMIGLQMLVKLVDATGKNSYLHLR